ncbi:MAG: helix-turn-helix domain-containing protein [Chloroflexota bacterium]
MTSPFLEHPEPSQGILLHQWLDIPRREPHSANELPFFTGNFDWFNSDAQASFPHRHDFYEILYITGGEGVHYLDFDAYPIEPPVLYFISPGQIHYWKTTVPLQGHAMLFVADFLLQGQQDENILHELGFFHAVEETPALTLRGQNAETMANLVHAIVDEFQADRFSRNSAIRSWFHLLLVQSQRLFNHASRTPEQSVPSTLVRHFKQLVSERFATEQSVQTYAEQLAVTPNHLSDTIKAMTGRTPGQLIRQEIALEAKRLLRHTDLTIAEIGYQLNFEDPSYFGRFFRREAGVSPGRFRQPI